MLHAMVLGYLPFNSKDKAELEKQILNNPIEYKRLKKLRNSSIKVEARRELNARLKKISDECIDLIEIMLNKDPAKRIDMIDIFDHPFMQKHKNRYDLSDASSSLTSEVTEEEDDEVTPIT